MLLYSKGKFIQLFYDKICIDGLSGRFINKLMMPRYYPKAVKVLAFS